MSTKQDQREVARTVSLLYARKVEGRDHIEDALALHGIAGSLHRYDERQCNEDLTCRACGGDGIIHPPHHDGTSETVECKACAGSGLTIGKRVAKLEARARTIATAYGFRLYVQGDPRGCPLYLIPESVVPITGKELDHHAYGKPAPLADLQARWIASNYNSRGVAVVWLG